MSVSTVEYQISYCADSRIAGNSDASITYPYKTFPTKESLMKWLTERVIDSSFPPEWKYKITRVHKVSSLSKNTFTFKDGRVVYATAELGDADARVD